MTLDLLCRSQFGKFAAITGNEWWMYDGTTYGWTNPLAVDSERIN